MALDLEIQTFKEQQSTLAEHPGEFVLIQGMNVIGFYPSFEDALSVGVQKFEQDEFLVRRIDSPDTPSTGAALG